MIEDIIILLFDSFNDCPIFDDNIINAVHLDILESSQSAHCVYHVFDSLQSGTKGIKLTKNEIFTSKK